MSVIYEGERKDGQPHGKGTCTTTLSDGRVTVYVGEWQFGDMHGWGTHSKPDGSKYEGEFRNNKMHGRGTYTFPSGSKWVGEFRNNQQFLEDREAHEEKPKGSTDYRARLVHFYTKVVNEPEKATAANVDMVLKKFAGDEEKLMTMLATKYGKPLSDTFVPQA